METETHVHEFNPQEYQYHLFAQGVPEVEFVPFVRRVCYVCGFMQRGKVAEWESVSPGRRRAVRFEWQEA